MAHKHYPVIDDFEGDWESYAEAREAYDEYESDMEDRAMEKYYDIKYNL